jgi:hypothetical protein
MYIKNIKKNFQKFTLFFLTALSLFIGIYLINIHTINQKYYEKYDTDSQVVMRKFPYPYRAAMAICSDIDNTETIEEFLIIHKFLNSDEMTSMGKGIGLEIGNSFFFFEPSNNAISYFNTDSNVSETIIRFIKVGYIDVLHSYGKKINFERQDAVNALQELNRHNCKVDVWVDHTKSNDNFGDDVTLGWGDHPGTREYHADLTLAHGIKFVWLGRVTMIAGQAVPVKIENFTDIFDNDHPMHSIINISKEVSKNVLGILGNKKYEMHKNNDLVKITQLNDGQKVYEFIRFDNYWDGVATGANSKGLAYVISKRTLDRLKKIGGYMIVYTHLGQNSACDQYICQETQDALRNLAKEFNNGHIYITTTSKLLKYFINHKYLEWSYNNQGDEINIHIKRVNDTLFGPFVPTVKDLEGITFYVPQNNKANIYLNNKKITDIRINPADYTRRESLTITPGQFFSKN